MVISRRQAIRHGGTLFALLRSALLPPPASSLSRELLSCSHLPLPEAVADRLSGSRYLFSAYMLQVVEHQSLIQVFPSLAEFGLYLAFQTTEEPVSKFVRIQLGLVVFFL